MREGEGGGEDGRFWLSISVTFVLLECVVRERERERERERDGNIKDDFHQMKIDRSGMIYLTTVLTCSSFFYWAEPSLVLPNAHGFPELGPSTRKYFRVQAVQLLKREM